MPQHDSALARLILVDVRWSEWNSESRTDREKYVKVIKELLQSPPPEAGNVGPAYIHMCYEKDQGPYYKKNQKPWVVHQAPYELPPRDDCQDTEQWLEDEEGLKQVDSALPMEGEPKSRTGKIQVHGVAEWGQLFRARIFMHAKRYRATVKCEGDANYWALIDMRFQQVENLVLWHTSLSVWSGPPWNTHHRPKSLQFKPKDSQACPPPMPTGSRLTSVIIPEKGSVII